MSKRTSRRLSLKKETLRSLDGRELAAVAGGTATTTCMGGSMGSTVSLGCQTLQCPVAPTGGGYIGGYLVSFTR